MRQRRCLSTCWVLPAPVMFLLGAVLGGFAGCANPLFPAGEDRSQFDAYDRARGQPVPAYVEDEFGRRRPNLRGRLLVRD